MVDLRTAVEGVRDAVANMEGNAAADQAGVLRVNLRDKRDLLARKIRQLSPSTLSVQVRTRRATRPARWAGGSSRRAKVVCCAAVLCANWPCMQSAVSGLTGAVRVQDTSLLAAVGEASTLLAELDSLD